ncbi:MAG: hypothetical protein LRY66_16375 [Saccharospirillaceae bacterium]|nr:hypothetical protein [Saccharospirillaceae bacterium]MCD8532882.1 hypothetical protein [Saccharospirillaceae bacterium]
MTTLRLTLSSANTKKPYSPETLAGRKSLLATAISLLLVSPAMLLPATVHADNPFAVSSDLPGVEWQTFSSEHFYFHFITAHKAHAERAAVIAERAWTDLTHDVGWTPKDRIHVVLTDDFDYSNGWAHPEPFNQIRLFLSPPDGNSTLEAYDDWLNLLITHELTHIIHIDMARGIPAAVRKVLGRNPLTFPHAYTPGFMIEGLAVYKETNAAQGFGRGQSAVYDMMMRMEVINGIDDLSQAVVTLRDWPLGKHYLYGYYYWQFIADTYGDDKIRAYLNEYSRNIVPYFFQNHDARNIFGKSHEALWQEFTVWLQQRFAPQIAELKKTADTPVQTISDEGLSMDAAASDGQNYYYLRTNGKDRNSLVKVRGAISHTDKPEHELLLQTTGMLSLDVSAQGDIAYTRITDRADLRGWSDIFVMRNGREQRLTSNQRYRAVRWMHNAGHPQQPYLIAKRIQAGISQLDMLDSNGTFIRTLWQGSLDDVLSDYAISHDGKKIVASIKRAQQGWNLELLNLQDDKQHWQPLTNTRANESSPNFSRDDQRIVYSANYSVMHGADLPSSDATYNLFSLNLANNEVTQITHLLGGAVQPVLVGNDIYFQSYQAQGFSHVRLPAEEQKALATFPVSDLKSQYDYAPLYNGTEPHSAAEEYSPWSSLMPQQWFPIFSANGEYNAIGLSTSGQDALGRHQYSTTLFADTTNDIASGNIVYSYNNQWQLLAQRNHSYYLNLHDKLQRIRREDTTELARTNIVDFLENKLQLSAGINRSHEYDIPADDLLRLENSRHNSVVGARLDFDNREMYSQSISISWGTQATLLWESNDYLDSDYSGDVINASLSHFIDLPGNQVLALHTSGAYGFEQPEPFELGGEESSMQPSLFGRDRWALRGYEENVQQGNRIQTNSIEYRFPLANIERGWNLFPIGLGGINANLFADHGAAWEENTRAHYLSSIGAELMTEVVVLYGFTLPVRLGYAHGFDKDQGGSRTYLSVNYQF